MLCFPIAQNLLLGNRLAATRLRRESSSSSVRCLCCCRSWQRPVDVGLFSLLLRFAAAAAEIDLEVKEDTSWITTK